MTKQSSSSTGMIQSRCVWLAAILSIFCFAVSSPIHAEERRLDFNRDIRPILSDTCYMCHGPDENTRAAGLRLDDRESTLSELDSGLRAIVPGEPDQSELFLRITSEDESIRMPPQDCGKTLKAEQIELLRQWITQGAEWAPHWSFVPPRKEALPEVNHKDFVRNEIDHFILNRLEIEGLTPAEEANASHLIRRVTFDLTGLPPTLEETRDFLNDTSPDAYEKLVDRLLHSPHYGERMANEWLDVARYADTHGYVIDGQRFMWRWRDWVIHAFNSNMPFDQFTIEQLAGDLLPEATLDQKIASGFNRNHVINSELGAIPEEYLVENISDRVQTTGIAWMGLTMQCARCHDHKYDPISQREFFEMYAFFNNIGEAGLDGLMDNAGPNISAPLPGQMEQIAELDKQIHSLQTTVNTFRHENEQSLIEWENKVQQPYQDVREGLRHEWTLDGHLNDSTENAVRGQTGEDFITPYTQGIFDRSVLSIGLAPTKFFKSAEFTSDDSFTFSCWVTLQNPHGRRSLFTKMHDGIDLERGYAFQVHEGRLSLALVHQYPNNCIEVESKRIVEPGTWMHVAASYDGSGKASGIRLYLNGEPLETQVIHDSLTGPIETSEALCILDGTPNAAIRGQMDEVRVYDRVLNDSEIVSMPGLPLDSLLAVPAEKRTNEAKRRIYEAYLEQQAAEESRDAYVKLQKTRSLRNELAAAIPTVMVMKENDKPTPTRMLIGGAYDQPGELVDRGTPGFLPRMSADLPVNRLGLARWLVNENHPLTARVTVNRYWQMYFGTGLVKTADDFGAQGESPSHPELLDWLAIRFMESGWDVRELQRLIVTSGVYRQSSQAPLESWQRDPENRLLSRGPRFRLSAEAIRDQALAVSGLLVPQIGGPSVKPYQPAGLWEEGAFDPTGNKFTAQIYHQDHGDKLYRRSLYTYWKRTAPPPAMLVLDAPERESCVVTRNRTNTPLQALVTMNDPTYVEASRKLAERMMIQGGESIEQRISFAFELLTCRAPNLLETLALQSLYEKQLLRFEQNPQEADRLLSVGESPRDSSLNTTQLASLTTIASVLLNLDETLTRN